MISKLVKRKTGTPKNQLTPQFFPIETPTTFKNKNNDNNEKTSTKRKGFLNNNNDNNNTDNNNNDNKSGARKKNKQLKGIPRRPRNEDPIEEETSSFTIDTNSPLAVEFQTKYLV